MLWMELAFTTITTFSVFHFVTTLTACKCFLTSCAVVCISGFQAVLPFACSSKYFILSHK